MVNLIPQSNDDSSLAFADYVIKPRGHLGSLARTSFLNCYQILRHIRIAISIQLSRTGMRYQAKLLTVSHLVSPLIDSKISYLSILVINIVML